MEEIYKYQKVLYFFDITISYVWFYVSHNTKTFKALWKHVCAKTLNSAIQVYLISLSILSFKIWPRTKEQLEEVAIIK